jgi:tol-pal system-associated acyl-CoA thioesterase
MSTFWLPVRVYLEDTDAQGVVYNASYFRFMERARTEWLRARGIDHSEILADHGVAFVLTAIESQFLAAGRLGDMLAVGAGLGDFTGARAVFAQQIRRGSQDGELLADGKAEVACIDAASGKARRWPQAILERLQE